MVDNLMESYLNNIAEQVVDKDKIVTYKSLSRILGIHVNTAKQFQVTFDSFQGNDLLIYLSDEWNLHEGLPLIKLLYTYYTNEKSKNSFPISATYLVAGKVVDGSFNITIVNEADLKNAYSTFVEVTSEHVYSIQKGKSLKDLKVLCGVQESSNSENSKLVITCSKGVLKSRDGEKKVPESREESNKKVITQALLPDKTKDEVLETNKKVVTTKNKEPVSKSPKKTTPKENTRKPAGNIANLFAKAAGKTTKSDKNASKTVPKEIESVDVPKIEPEKSEEKNLKSNSESKENLKKKNGNKRKRIQMLSDSEGSDTNDKEEEIEREEIESPPITINIDEEEEEEEKDLIPRNKRKKRKVIDKTVMNEDGYLETKKEVVFQTDSENEVEEIMTTSKVTKKLKAEPAKGAAGTAKKQSSLLTFFKKN